MRSYIAIVAVLAAVLAVSGARAVPAATDFRALLQWPAILTVWSGLLAAVTSQGYGRR